MIIFKKKYEEAGRAADKDIDEELKELMKKAGELVDRAGKGVLSERSPITLIEKVQINDTVKLVKKLMIDIDSDIKKGRDTGKDKEKLKNAVTALGTSIDNIL